MGTKRNHSCNKIVAESLLRLTLKPRRSTRIICISWFLVRLQTGRFFFFSHQPSHSNQPSAGGGVVRCGAVRCGAIPSLVRFGEKNNQVIVAKKLSRSFGVKQY